MKPFTRRPGKVYFFQRSGRSGRRGAGWLGSNILRAPDEHGYILEEVSKDVVKTVKWIADGLNWSYPRVWYNLQTAIVAGIAGDPDFREWFVRVHIGSDRPLAPRPKGLSKKYRWVERPAGSPPVDLKTYKPDFRSLWLRATSPPWTKSPRRRRA